MSTKLTDLEPQLCAGKDHHAVTNVSEAESLYFWCPGVYCTRKQSHRLIVYLVLGKDETKPYRQATGNTVEDITLAGDPVVIPGDCTSNAQWYVRDGDVVLA